MNRMAMAVSSMVAITIHRRKMWPWVAKARSRGAIDPQHAAFDLHADVDIGGVAGGIEPERRVQPVGEGFLQRAVEGGEQ
jgi:hypothetical protein